MTTRQKNPAIEAAMKILESDEFSMDGKDTHDNHGERPNTTEPTSDDSAHNKKRIASKPSDADDELVDDPDELPAASTPVVTEEEDEELEEGETVDDPDDLPGSSAPEVTEEEDDEELEEEDDEYIEEEEEDLEEEIAKLFGGKDLSESFRKSATLLFVTSVNKRVSSIKTKLQERYDRKLQKSQTKMEEKIDQYLDYVVEEWAKENQVQIQNTIRTELAESFMEGLRDLLVQHNIDIPDSKVDALDEANERIEELEESLTNLVESSSQLKKRYNKIQTERILQEATKHMSDVARDKVIELAENVNTRSPDLYAEKLATIIDLVEDQKNFNGVDSLDESLESGDPRKNTINENPIMEKYHRSLSGAARRPKL